jgi:hypothetical protein
MTFLQICSASQRLTKTSRRAGVQPVSWRIGRGEGSDEEGDVMVDKRFRVHIMSSAGLVSQLHRPIVG